MTNRGRPSEYKEEYCDRVDDYLKENIDKEVQIVRQSNAEKGYEMYDNKLSVQLPTKEGFAQFLGVAKKTLYNWADENEDFLHALEKIEVEQQRRLINSGLSGEYNSTIAKLILSANHGMREGKDITSAGEKIQTNSITFQEFNDESNSTSEQSVSADVPKTEGD